MIVSPSPGLPGHLGDAAAEQRALREDAGLVDLGGTEILRARGRDALPLVHRLSTADLLALRPGQGAATLLTSPKGRVVERCAVLREETGALLLCAAGRGASLRDWVGRYTIREDIALAPPEPVLGVLGVAGPRAADVLAGTLGLDLADAPRWHALRAATGEGPLAVRGDPIAGEGWLLIGERAALDAARDALSGAARPCGLAAFEAARLASLLPGPGRELGEDHNPWELGLHEDVSMTKGCYVGQEVVARLRNYGKVHRILCLLETDEEAGGLVGRTLLHGAREVGRVTSAARRDGGATLALAVLPLTAARQGLGLPLAGGGGVLTVRRAAGLPEGAAAADGEEATP